MFFLTILNFWKEKKTKSEAKPNHSTTNIGLLSDKQITILPYLLFASCIFFFITSTYHAFHLTKSLADAFLFQDADYIGISDILLSISRGEGFTSGYYSESGEGSYLSHHFAPGMVVLSPLVSLIPNRWGLAAGVFLVYQLGTILWLFWAYQITKKNFKEFGVKFLVFWVLVTNQLYLYRLGSSFHFEVLVLIFGLFFFYIWEQREKIQKVPLCSPWIYHSVLALAIVLYLSQKEDIGIYLFLFFLPTVFGISYNLWKKKKYENRDLQQPSGSARDNSQEKANIQSLTLVFSIVFVWLGFVFFLYPTLGDHSESIIWTKVLTQEYHSAFKQVTGAKKSLQIFLELIISVGLGIFQMIPEVIGIGLIYATHVFSSRPWHHEVYTYYSYSLVPFLLYSGILWIRSEKKINLSFAFLILTCLFWKNSLDQNVPLDHKIESPWKNPTIQMEIQSDLKEVNLILLSTHKGPIFGEPKEKPNPKNPTYPNEPLDHKEKANRIFVFAQYNLSFYITDKTTTYPLEQIKNSSSICKKANVCYVVIAPEFTDEFLWPKSRILEYKNELETQKGVFVWKGKKIEVWKLPPMN
nr:DUF2079 domain-containing protein [Leptospira mtsangambouensis]